MTTGITFWVLRNYGPEVTMKVGAGLAPEPCLDSGTRPGFGSGAWRSTERADSPCQMSAGRFRKYPGSFAPP